MRIQRIALKDFRGVGSADIAIAETGVTIVEGPNEIGKSSLAEALYLLFDELDRNLSVGSTTKNQHKLTDNLREIVDLCGRGALPGVLFAYAVPPEFMARVVDEYPALKQRLASPLPLSVRSPQAAVIDLETLDLHPKDLLMAMGERIRRVFEVARDVKFDAILQAANLSRIATEAATSQFEVSHRRIFVKAWVSHLHDQLVTGERAVSSAAGTW